MAVPKTTETRCMDGSVQARQVVKRLGCYPMAFVYMQACRGRREGG